MTTCWVLASGPSLKGQDLSFLRNRWVITVNRTHELVREAQRLEVWWTDFRFWEQHHAALTQRYHYAPFKTRFHAGLDHAGRHDQYPQWVRRWALSKARGLTTAGPLSHGNNGGYTAISLAWRLGARRIFLLGYDMKLGPGGEGHWHEDHPNGPMRERTLREKMAPYFNDLARDLRRQECEVTNLTPGSALYAFPHGNLDDFKGYDE